MLENNNNRFWTLQYDDNEEIQMADTPENGMDGWKDDILLDSSSDDVSIHALERS
jgi:hypothetical protein